MKVPKSSNPFSSTLLLVAGFAGMIILGTILLIFPVSSSSGQFTSPVDAFFTATSAVCVTGLVVVDTGTHWSTFGQAVLLVLFQIGGLGFITGATVLLMLFAGRFGLRERLVITESMGLDRLGGLLGIVAKVALFSLIIELAGVCIFYIRGLVTGDGITSLWTAFFHSISAFNNCGMDIFGDYKSVSGFQGDTPFLLVTALLVITGSTGYIVIANILSKRKFNRLTLDSKMVLVSTLALITLASFIIFGLEYSNPATLGPLAVPQKMVVAFFQAVIPRTAGFSAIDVAGFRSSSLFFVIVLMFIGGSSGSTAGGIKINTFGVLIATVIGTLKGKPRIDVFGRQLPYETIYRAITLTVFYLGMAGLVMLLLSISEPFAIEKIFFETFSALSTVGLTTGITPYLSTGGKVIVILAMFIGRLGPLVLMATLGRRRIIADIEYPRESVRIG
ncbi:MAG: hypothetical protein JXA46_13305 [Dehalococcoidales bacterium]|nr:hypothetical protein [Dehalococcoidales bacterium]